MRLYYIIWGNDEVLNVWLGPHSGEKVQYNCEVYRGYISRNSDYIWTEVKPVVNNINKVFAIVLRKMV